MFQREVPILVQVLAMGLTELAWITSSEELLVCPVRLLGLPPPDEADAEFKLPAIFTSWPTASLNFAASPIT